MELDLRKAYAIFDRKNSTSRHTYTNTHTDTLLFTLRMCGIIKINHSNGNFARIILAHCAFFFYATASGLSSFGILRIVVVFVAVVRVCCCVICARLRLHCECDEDAASHTHRHRTNTHTNTHSHRSFRQNRGKPNVQRSTPDRRWDENSGGGRGWTRIPLHWDGDSKVRPTIG